MGLPALRYDVPVRAERTRLHVVRQPRITSPRRNTAAHEARCRSTFNLVLFAMCALALCGLGRVALSANAIEASIDSSSLRGVIREEQRTVDELELDKSSLMTPSRIEAIAGTTMSMSEADDVCFITYSDVVEQTTETEDDLVEADTGVAVADATDVDVKDSPLRSLLGYIMDMAAGEAQVLLVGDIGLATSR